MKLIFASVRIRPRGAHAILVAAASLFGTVAGHSQDAVWQFSTLAGSSGGRGMASGYRLVARLNSPTSVAADSQGNVYVADYGNNCIRRIDPIGGVTVFAGAAGAPGFADGARSAARFNGPSSVAVDPSGIVYVADTANCAIRRIATNGVVTTVAGGPEHPGYADGAAAVAGFLFPAAVAVDMGGAVYVADYGNSVVRKILGGVVSTVAGVAGVVGSADGARTNASFAHPGGVGVDAQGVLYVTDSDNSTLRRITPDGAVTTVAGAAGAPGSQDGPGPQARFSFPQGVAVNASGTVFVADTGNNTLRVLTADGKVTTLAGIAGVVGSADGSGTNAQFNAPAGVALDGQGALYLADQANHTVRRIATNGVVETFAGAADAGAGFADGPGSSASFNGPRGIAVDVTGDLVIADDWNFAVRRVAPDGTVSTQAALTNVAAAVLSVAIAPSGGVVAGVTAASKPRGAQRAPDQILGITSGGAASVLAGGIYATGQFPSFTPDGTGTNATLNGVAAIVADGAGAWVFADRRLGAVRRISGLGKVTTLAGAYHMSAFDFIGNGAEADGTNAAAGFVEPSGLTLGADGSLYVVDTGANVLRKVTFGGVVTTPGGVAGKTNPGFVDGPLIVARFEHPTAIASDADGNLFVADQHGTVIRRIGADGSVATVAGGAGVHGISDGFGAGVEFEAIGAMAFDQNGTLYVADTGANRLLIGAPIGDIRLGAVWSSDGTTLTLASPLPGTYMVQAATTLAAGGDWRPLPGLDAIAVPSGPTSWVDSTAGDGARFYRAVQLP
jgi:sugar lactone lactonase YvrE